MADLPDIPAELLGDIVLKLDTIEDFVNFSSVCRSWNLSTSGVKSHWISKVPYLLLGEHIGDNDIIPETRRKIFSITKNKCHEINVPEIFGARIWGSPHGWLVVFSQDLQICLFNPLTKAKLNLPPLALEEIREEHEDEWVKNHYIIKATLMREPHTGNFIVFIIYKSFRRCLAFARPGDRAWTEVLETPKRCTLDVVLVDHNILIIYRDGGIKYCDIRDLRGDKNVVPKKYLAPPRDILRPLSILHSLYLVESYGDILLVLRNKRVECDEPYTLKTYYLEVYKLDLETKLWKKLNSLGDFALFVGNDCSMVINVSDARKFKANCIYYTDDEEDIWILLQKWGERDFGCFCLENEEILSFEEITNIGDDIQSKLSPSFWFIPKF